jgi:hypothetical protein
MSNTRLMVVRHGLLLLCLLLPFQLTAQPSEVTVPINGIEKKELRVSSDIDCASSNYKIGLKSNRDFLKLPSDATELSNPGKELVIELSNRDTELVVMEFHAGALEPGSYDATISIDCIECGRCKSRVKTRNYSMIVVGSANPESDVQGHSAAEEITVELYEETVGEPSADLVTDTLLTDSAGNEALTDSGTDTPITGSAGNQAPTESGTETPITGSAGDEALTESVGDTTLTDSATNEALTESDDESDLPVPDLDGMSVSEALARLEQAGIAMITPIPDINRPELLRIIGQSPPPGGSVPAGSEVELEFGVSVPDLVGLTSEEALSALTERGLAGSITGRASMAPDGLMVSAQNPGSDDIHPIGGSVAIVLVPDGASTSDDNRWLAWIAAPVALALVVIFLLRSKIGKRATADVDFQVTLTRDAGIQHTTSGPSDVAGSAITFRLTEDAGVQSLRGQDPA